MKLCLACGSALPTERWACPSCGWEPAHSDGFLAFAPRLAHENDAFPAESHDFLDIVQGQSFWFRSRNRLIGWIIRRHFPQAWRVLEIGCGTGFVLAGIADVLPDAALVGSEIHTSGLRGAARRLGARAELLQMDAVHIPYRDEFDLVCAFDVIEHIEDDAAAIEQMRQAAKPGGGVLIAVPQHPFLWSREDEIGHHKRRYRRGELDEKCRACGLEIVLSTSFVTTLLPFMVAARLLSAGRTSASSTGQLVPPGPLNAIFERALDLETWAIALGARLPVGGSRFVLARKAAG